MMEDGNDENCDSIYRIKSMLTQCADQGCQEMEGGWPHCLLDVGELGQQGMV